MIATVCKRFKFSAAHYLPGSPGACANLHGHTLYAEIFARSAVGEFGMVVDFTHLKQAWAEVEGRLDHALLNDQLETPSTENAAAFILGEMRPGIPEIFKVRLWEGPEQYAEVEL